MCKSPSVAKTYNCCHCVIENLCKFLTYFVSCVNIMR